MKKHCIVALCHRKDSSSWDQSPEVPGPNSREIYIPLLLLPRLLIPQKKLGFLQECIFLLVPSFTPVGRYQRNADRKIANMFGRWLSVVTDSSLNNPLEVHPETTGIFLENTQQQWSKICPLSLLAGHGICSLVVVEQAACSQWKTSGNNKAVKRKKF